MRRVRELDGLRAVAIFLVLGCHYAGFSQWLGKLPEFGWIGVDIFFVLSGYLITTILLGLRDRSTPYKTFYSRRLIRILPPYLAVIALVTTFGVFQHWATINKLGRQLLFLHAYGQPQTELLRHVLGHPVQTLGNLPSLFSHAHHLPSGTPGADLRMRVVPNIFWSLSVEEYFYLLWAPVVLHFSRRNIVRIAVAVCLLEMFLRWVGNTQYSYFGLIFRFDSLLYGAFLAILLEYWRRHGTPAQSQAVLRSVFFAGVAGVAAILFLIRPILGREIRESPLVMVFGLPLFSLAAAAGMGLLVLRANSNWWLSRLLRARPFQFIGTVSYTMYLVHLVAATAVRHLAGGKDPLSQTFLQATVSVVLTVALAQLSWRYLESPLLQWKDRHFPNTPHPAEPTVSWTAPEPVEQPLRVAS